MGTSGKRQDAPWRDEREAALTRHEETLDVGTRWVDDGRVQVRKSVETIPVDAEVQRNIVFMDAEHAPPSRDDDGQVHELEDGTLSIPVLEEEIVVTRRTVVRERLLVKRKIVTEPVTIHDEVRRERVEVEATDDADLEVKRGAYTAPFPQSSADPKRKIPD